jgi:hypothetical protein
MENKKTTDGQNEKKDMVLTKDGIWVTHEEFLQMQANS